MKIKQGMADEFASWKLKNSGDPYGACIFEYAETWAMLMEVAMSRGASLKDCAKPTSRVADHDGITGFMYGAAVAVLAKCWEHGEELRVWHNIDTQIGTEGEDANKNGGVLNPAMISVGRPRS